MGNAGEGGKLSIFDELVQGFHERQVAGEDLPQAVILKTMDEWYELISLLYQCSYSSCLAFEGHLEVMGVQVLPPERKRGDQPPGQLSVSHGG